MSAPKVTILTAVKNGARHIASTIECALSQSFKDWEYIIVDDASTDQTVGVVAEFQRKDSRIHLVTRPVSGGPYIAANEGLRQARGQYIVRTDADDHFPSHRIERQLQFLKEHPEFRSCVSYWRGFTDENGPSRMVRVPSNSRVFRWELLLRAPSLHSAVCYERSAIEELGGYRQLPLSQDYRLFCELACRDWLGVIPEILCYVRFHPTRQTSTNPKTQMELGLDVLSDHMIALTGERWSREDLTALRAVGLSQRMPVEKGLEMLDRWDRLWMTAAHLTREDREELGRTSAFRRWKHLLSNARTQPVTVMMGLLKLATTKSQTLLPALREAR